MQIDQLLTRNQAPCRRLLGALCDVIQHHIPNEESRLLRLADSMFSQEQIKLAAKMKELKPLVCVTAASGTRSNVSETSLK
jgi:hypothetical protein